MRSKVLEQLLLNESQDVNGKGRNISGLEPITRDIMLEVNRR